MSDPGDQYQPFIDAIRDAASQLDAAQAAETVQWQRVEQARIQFRQAVAQLVDYILH